jgi:hypothetical protein
MSRASALTAWEVVLFLEAHRFARRAPARLGIRDALTCLTRQGATCSARQPQARDYTEKYEHEDDVANDEGYLPVAQIVNPN